MTIQGSEVTSILDTIKVSAMRYNQDASKENLFQVNFKTTQ